MKQVDPKTYVFPITPQTHVRTTQHDRIFFRIPRKKLKPDGLRRLERIERYNKYKQDIGTIAKSMKFSFPPVGAIVRFYLPVPSSWPKKKKEYMHLRYHQTRADIDNLLKGFFDALMDEDKHIAHLSGLSKQWINSPSGKIEVVDTFKDPRIV